MRSKVSASITNHQDEESIRFGLVNIMRKSVVLPESMEYDDIASDVENHIDQSDVDTQPLPVMYRQMTHSAVKMKRPLEVANWMEASNRHGMKVKQKQQRLDGMFLKSGTSNY